MKPYHQEDGVTLYCGDARDILPQIEIPAEAVLIADPPYALDNKFGTSACYGREGRRMQFDFDRGGEAIAEVVEVLRFVFPRVDSYHLFCGTDHWGRIASLARDAGLTPKPWARLKLCPPAPMPGNWWVSAFELAQYGYRPSAGAYFGDQGPQRPNTYTADGYRHGIRTAEQTGHPTQKWLPMIQYIVKTLVRPRGAAIDPFAGSGTTLVAARSLGCRAIGIELEERYCEMAANRLRQSRLFA